MLTCQSCGRESPDDFRFCPECSTPLVPAAPAPEIRKTVTVVFCDVTGSTALGERLDPESLRDVQTRYFDAMGAAIERHGGTVEKYIGDAVMAVFGMPQLHEDDALRASRAVVDMREGLAALNKELERDRGVTLRVVAATTSSSVTPSATCSSRNASAPPHRRRDVGRSTASSKTSPAAARSRRQHPPSAGPSWPRRVRSTRPGA
jgi:class 3 adenylate cyclase